MSFDLSTSTYVYGIRLPGSEWRRMKAVWDACRAADVEAPEEVSAFFNWEEPDEVGVVIDLEKAGAARIWKPGGDSMREGVEVNLERLPEDIAIIRFVNSY